MKNNIIYCLITALSCVTLGVLNNINDNAPTMPSTDTKVSILEPCIPLYDVNGGSGAVTYYMNVNIHGIGSKRFLIDTGCSSYIILPNDDKVAMLANGVMTNDDYIRSVDVVVANGQYVHLDVYRVKDVVLGERAIVHDVEVCFSPLGEKRIIGCPMLRRLGTVTFDFNHKALRISDAYSE